MMISSTMFSVLSFAVSKVMILIILRSQMENISLVQIITVESGGVFGLMLYLGGISVIAVF